MFQGQGDGTLRKEEAFGKLFRMSLQIGCAPAVAGFPFWHIDLNSGCGWNHKANCMGSPLVFLESAVRVCRPGAVNALFCDIDPAKVQELRGHCFSYVERLPNATVSAKACDNADFLDDVACLIREEERFPEKAIGTCLCDPNGFRGGFPVDALAEFACRFPRIDLIININCSLFRSVGGCCLEKANVPFRTKETFRSWPTVPEIVSRLARQHWMIRNVQRGNGHHFTQLVGRNIPTGKRPFSGFFSLESREGQQILHTLKRVEPDQGYLFEDFV